jgi:hypothetical protein
MNNLSLRCNDFGSCFVSEWPFRPLTRVEPATVVVLSFLHTFNVRRCMILRRIKSVYIVYENVVLTSENFVTITKKKRISASLDMIPVPADYHTKRIHTLWRNVEFIISDTDKRTYILLNHHFINTVRNSNTFQPLKSLLQGV